MEWDLSHDSADALQNINACAVMYKAIHDSIWNSEPLINKMLVQVLKLQDN